jgi:transcriptional regulator GlxA family with amidase domain
MEVTTHFQSIDALKQLAPKASVNPTKRYADNGKIITSAGISAGIDMALHVCEKLWGLKVAVKIAEYMEYEWKRTEQNISLEHLYKLIE